MRSLSKKAKEEIIDAMEEQNAAMFTAEGKLVSLEVHDNSSIVEEPDNVAQEIEDNPNLKKSLQRFLNDPDMSRYTAEELKESRHDRR